MRSIATLGTVAALALAGCGGEGEGGGGLVVRPDGGGDGDAIGPPLGDGIVTPPGGSDAGQGCEHLDVLFALDNSGSMSEEKSAMANQVFPAFAEQLLGTAGIQDFRAAVIDACPLPASFHTRGMSGECNFEGGADHMVSSSSALVGEFACVADLWADDIQCSGKNDDEQPASAAAAALASNASFLRDEALLVIVAITDEDEQPVPQASVGEVHDALVAAKADPNHVVFLGIGGKSFCQGVYGEADHAVTLEALAASFGKRGVFWDLCGGELAAGLGAAVGAIDQACSEFEAPK
jgi:hypothetical protein